MRRLIQRLNDFDMLVMFFAAVIGSASGMTYQSLGMTLAVIILVFMILRRLDATIASHEAPPDPLYEPPAVPDAKPRQHRKGEA